MHGALRFGEWGYSCQPGPATRINAAHLAVIAAVFVSLLRIGARNAGDHGFARSTRVMSTIFWPLLSTNGSSIFSMM
jgi:hypothetical protein